MKVQRRHLTLALGASILVASCALSGGIDLPLKDGAGGPDTSADSDVGIGIDGGGKGPSDGQGGSDPCDAMDGTAGAGGCAAME